MKNLWSEYDFKIVEILQETIRQLEDQIHTFKTVILKIKSKYEV